MLKFKRFYSGSVFNQLNQTEFFIKDFSGIYVRTFYKQETDRYVFIFNYKEVDISINRIEDVTSFQNIYVKISEIFHSPMIEI